MVNKSMLACLLLGLVAAASAQSDASGPVAFAPTTATTASAPNPSASARVRTGQYASDSLANTPTSYNQIQVRLALIENCGVPKFKIWHDVLLPHKLEGSSMQTCSTDTPPLGLELHDLPL